MKPTYVLYIEFADDPPRVAVFDSFDEAEEMLDAFEVSLFDPPQNDGLRDLPFRARIFDCSGGCSIGDSSWGIELDISAAVNGRRREIRENPGASWRPLALIPKTCIKAKPPNFRDWIAAQKIEPERS